MTIPLHYEDLTPEAHAWICNGCGPAWDRVDLVPDFIFTEAGNRHDFDYWSGFNENDRQRADQRFLNNMLLAAKARPGWWDRQWYTFLAWRYYSAVRLFGKSFFRYRKSYGTAEDLAREMNDEQ